MRFRYVLGAALLSVACEATPLENVEMALEAYPPTDAGSVDDTLEYISRAKQQVEGADLIELEYLEEQVAKREADKDSFYLSMERLRFLEFTNTSRLRK